MQASSIRVKTFPGMGRGLVSMAPIRKNTVIMLVEVIELSRKDSKILKATKLDHYVYDLGGGTTGVALGLGSLFNHSNDNNVAFETDATYHGRKVISYKTLRDIKAGEQLFLNYGYTPKVG